MDFHVNPAVQECKKILEVNGAKAGEAPFNPAYLTSEVVTLPPGGRRRCSWWIFWALRTGELWVISGDLWWFKVILMLIYGDLVGFNGIYPLGMTDIAVEHGHLERFLFD